MFWRRKRGEPDRPADEARPEIDLDAPEPDASDFALDDVDEAPTSSSRATLVDTTSVSGSSSSPCTMTPWPGTIWSGIDVPQASTPTFANS